MEQNRKKVYSKKVKRQKLNKLVQDCSEFQDLTTKNSSASSINVSVSSNDSDNLNISDSNILNDSSDVFTVSSINSDYSSTSDSTCSKDTFENKLSEVEELREWAVLYYVPQNTLTALLKILRRRLLPMLPKHAKSFLKYEKSVREIEKMTVCDGSEGDFIYYGIQNQLQKTVQIELHDTETLELVFNIDGMSPFKSSSVTVWPILCKVYTELDLYNPFTIALYSGNGKPMSCKEYLKKFILELNQLLKNGVIIQEKEFKVKIKYFICDCPARAFLKCIVSHVSFNACERCKGLGKKVDKTTVFLELDALLRTDEDFRSFLDPECHTAVSPLTAVEPKINLVSQFILDPMHLLYLGCTKRLLEYLLSSSTHKIRLSATQKKELIRRSKIINKDIPIEFPRKMRSTEHFSKYKAVEHKFFTLYAAPIILKKVLSDDVYKHFMLYTVSCRLLSQQDRNIHIEEAKRYLRTFVANASVLYGTTFISLNIHNLIHICDDVERTGCSLSELSAFTFESYLGGISRVIKSPNHIVAQYCNRLEEQENFVRKKITIPPELEIIKRRKSEIVKIKYKGMTISLKHPNNTVLLRNKSVVEICKFNYSEANKIISVKVKKYLRKESVFDYPCNSNTLNIFEVSNLSKVIMTITLDSIEKKLVKMNLNFSSEENCRTFVVPLLH